MAELWQDDLVERVTASLPAHVLRYFQAGSRDEITVGEAGSAWREIRFAPRVLRDVREPRTAATLLGSPVAAPIGIAPTSLQRLGHPEGELAMARGAAAAEALMVVSSNAGTPFEDIAATGVSWWLQAYLTADRELIAPTLLRAVAAGARAIVLTVDTPSPGPKYGLVDDAFGDLALAYGVNHPDVVRGTTPGSAFAADLGPRDIAWLTELTGLPVVVKGVLRPDDARRCVDAGAEAVWVSNHGGRQLDRSMATARALEAVAQAVDEPTEVYVDGGLSSGLDVLAALACGARAAFCGRLPLFALCDRGADGVSTALLALRAELVSALALAGCPSTSDALGIVAPPATNRL